MLKKNISNIITIFGLLLVNYSLYMYSITNNITYLLFMVIGYSCDYIDGWVARKLNIASTIGSILDGIVDKINHFILICCMYKKFNLSKKYILLFLIKEIILLFLRCINIKPSKPSFYDKLKTFIFPLSFFLYITNSPLKKIYLNFWFIYDYICLVL
jgi:phosphatidylglycerophosphate synthase